MMVLSCRTDQAIILVAVPDGQGVYRFPHSSELLLRTGMYGIPVTIKPLLPVAPQLLDAVNQVMGFDISRSCELFQTFADEVQVSEEQHLTVFLVRLLPEGCTALPSSIGDWNSLPHLLRQLPKDRRRLPYLRALQLLTGALSLQTKVVDLDEVAKHLTDV